jgi:hypothetical protein
MRRIILAAAALVLVSLSSTALAEESGAKKPIVIKVTITGSKPIPVAVDVAKLVMKAPLPDLRKPLTDPASVLDRDPF